MADSDDLLKKLRGLIRRGKVKADVPEPELCREVMCLGTPGDIVRLINAGYIHLLRVVTVKMVALHKEGAAMHKDIHMVQLDAGEGGCVMYKQGRCLLREYDLTPVMGRLHHLLDGLGWDAVEKTAFQNMVLEWDDEKNAPAVRFCLQSVLRLSGTGNNHTN